jgi:serine/threonine-protein kinase RsbW
VTNSPSNRVGVVLPVEVASIAEARRQVGEWLSGMGCSDRCVTDATIAVTEAVTNAVRHGYEDGQPGELRLSVSQVDAEVVLSIEDDGRGPGPNLARHGTGGGLGIPLMAELARLLTIRGSKDTGTTVTLSFPCPTAR